MHENPNDGDMWAEAIDAKWYGNESIKLDNTFWDKLLGHVSAVTDVPANMFGPELIAAYPDAKVILIERDVDKWYPSFEQALIKSNEHPLLLNVFANVEIKLKKLNPVIQRGMMRGQFQASNPLEWRKNAKRVYREHYAEIRELLKDQPLRLLNYQLDQGWDPICEFLGQPIPTTPFPRVNETAQHDEMVRVTMMQMSRTILSKSLIWTSPIPIGVLAWKWWHLLS